MSVDKFRQAVIDAQWSDDSGDYGPSCPWCGAWGMPTAMTPIPTHKPDCIVLAALADDERSRIPAYVDAILSEREACAKVADDAGRLVMDCVDGMARSIAAAIRARGGK